MPYYKFKITNEEITKTEKKDPLMNQLKNYEITDVGHGKHGIPFGNGSIICESIKRKRKFVVIQGIIDSNSIEDIFEELKKQINTSTCIIRIFENETDQKYTILSFYQGYQFIVKNCETQKSANFIERNLVDVLRIKSQIRRMAQVIMATMIIGVLAIGMIAVKFNHDNQLKVNPSKTLLTGFDKFTHDKLTEGEQVLNTLLGYAYGGELLPALSNGNGQEVKEFPYNSLIICADYRSSYSVILSHSINQLQKKLNNNNVYLLLIMDKKDKFTSVTEKGKYQNLNHILFDATKFFQALKSNYKGLVLKTNQTGGIINAAYITNKIEQLETQTYKEQELDKKMIDKILRVYDKNYDQLVDEKYKEDQYSSNKDIMIKAMIIVTTIVFIMLIINILVMSAYNKKIHSILRKSPEDY